LRTSDERGVTILRYSERSDSGGSCGVEASLRGRSRVVLPHGAVARRMWEFAADSIAGRITDTLEGENPCRPASSLPTTTR
jgi:hypothetical protein